MLQQNKPKEHKTRREILTAIKKVDCLADLLSTNEDHPDQFDYELDLEVIVYGRTYHHKPVGPYLQLLTYDPGQTIIKQGEWADNYYYIVVEGYVEVVRVDSTGEEREVSKLGVGEQFGAKTMLAGARRQVSVKTPSALCVQVLKVHRPAIRLLRKLPSFDERFQDVYQRHGVEAAIDNLVARTGMRPELRHALIEVSLFKAFAKNHILFAESGNKTRLFLIMEGWVRRSRQMEGPEIRDFLGKGYCLGLEDGIAKYRYTATALSRLEVLEINVVKLGLNKELKTALLPALKQFAAPAIQESVEGFTAPVREKVLAAQESLINTGLVDANNLLVMDMDLCVRCGNCSMACHKVHGRSRLTRRGVHITRIEPAKRRSFQSLLAPAACMHCNDPECLTGCPTGAIGRFEEGQIDIDPKTCIGCGDCATQCPYDAIFMINCDEAPSQPRGTLTTRLWRNLLGFKEPQEPPVDIAKDLVAVKCNLCSDRTTLNPPGSAAVYSCEENCPTGALARIIPDDYFGEIARIKNLTMLDQRHAYGRNIHTDDPIKRRIHGVCILASILAVVGTIAGLHYYGYSRPFFGIFDMRWGTGVMGFLSIIAASAYHWRREIYDRRRWPLRYWMLIHSYLGVTACVIVLLHGGTFSGGWLTAALMISFDGVVFTGLFGLACYQIIPRVLTRIEGAPLLLEDLKARRDELREELSEIIRTAPEHLRVQLRKSVSRRFDSFNAVFHVLAQESLGQLLKTTSRESRIAAEQLRNEEEQRILNEAARAVALLPRVNALISLHRLLKVWIAPHMAFAYVTVALMVIHIFQVLYAIW
ncbi:MAG: cyclic nucleotide-binding domain-containing protein [Blastocatellia bacterium]